MRFINLTGFMFSCGTAKEACAIFINIAHITSITAFDTCNGRFTVIQTSNAQYSLVGDVTDAIMMQINEAEYLKTTC